MACSLPEINISTSSGEFLYYSPPFLGWPIRRWMVALHPFGIFRWCSLNPLPHHPVLYQRRFGHAMLVNAATQYLCLDILIQNLDGNKGHFRSWNFFLAGTLGWELRTTELRKRKLRRSTPCGSNDKVHKWNQRRIPDPHLLAPVQRFYWRKCEHKKKEVRERCSNNMKQQIITRY